MLAGRNNILDFAYIRECLYTQYLVSPEKVVHKLFQGIEAKILAQMRGFAGIFASRIGLIGQWPRVTAMDGGNAGFAWSKSLSCVARRPEKCRYHRIFGREFLLI